MKHRRLQKHCCHDLWNKTRTRGTEGVPLTHTASFLLLVPPGLFISSPLLEIFTYHTPVSDITFSKNPPHKLQGSSNDSPVCFFLSISAFIRVCYCSCPFTWHYLPLAATVVGSIESDMNEHIHTHMHTRVCPARLSNSMRKGAECPIN